MIHEIHHQNAFQVFVLPFGITEIWQAIAWLGCVLDNSAHSSASLPVGTPAMPSKATRSLPR